MSGNLIAMMREAIEKSGSNKRDFLFVRPDQPIRVRFLQELDAGVCVDYHNDYDKHIFMACTEDDNCQYCKDGIYKQHFFNWSVWDYDANAVRIVQFKANGVSPIPALIEMFEEFGTIMDRDYKIKKIGKGQGSTFTVTPLEKGRFRGDAKPFTNDEIREKCIAASTMRGEGYGDDELPWDGEEESAPSGNVEKPAKKKKKVVERKEKTLREKYDDLSEDELKQICLEELGMSKKEYESCEDKDGVVKSIFDDYEEDDLLDCYNAVVGDSDE